MQPPTASDAARSKVGRPPTHNATAMRRALTRLGTRRLDRRSTVAVAARRFKIDLARDLGGDPSRAQATLIKLAARTWIIAVALDDVLMRQPSLVTKKRTVVSVRLQRQQLAESLAWMLERLGRERRAKDVTNLAHYLETKPTTRSLTTPTEDRP
jgi:hypothetical protein